MLDIERLYRDFNINYATEGHKHCRPGWVNTECPFCSGNPGLHLGYDTSLDRFVCWRCGGHAIWSVLLNLLHTDATKLRAILNQYGFITKQEKKIIKIRLKPFKYPEPFFELEERHKDYLYNRDFDAIQLTRDWSLLATGVYAKLDEIDYKHRIIIPFTWDGRIVSFDSRDITGKASNKYMACPEAREEIGHKKILYGKQDKWKETGICVEGPSDVWRFGVYAFATSGIKYTVFQMRLIAKTFKRVFIIYDNDSQAQRQAKKLQADLKFRKVDCHILTVDDDPGNMDQKEADYLVKQLIK